MEHWGDRYQLVRELAGTASNQVYTGLVVAPDSGDTTEIAMTIIGRDLASAPGAIDQIREQVARVQGVGDRHLAAVRDVVVESGRVALITDPLPPTTLRDWLNSNGPILPAQVAQLGAELALALQTLHNNGVLHLAVCPENVRLDGPAAVLTGHGIAPVRMNVRPSGRNDLARDLPHYIAPELLGDAPVGPGADVYSLGVVLYEACCGVPPFVGSLPDVLTAHRTMTPGLRRDVPAPLWRVLTQLLNKDPAARPPAGRVAAELVELVPLLTGAPVLSASSPPAPLPILIPGVDDMAKRRRRKVILAAVGAAAVIALVALVVPFGAGGQETNQANQGEPPQQPTGRVDSTTGLRASEANVTTTTKAVTSMPDLVGSKLTDARTKLPPGVSIETVPTEGSASEDGVIKDQSPKAGQPIGGTVKLTVSRVVVPIQLDTLEPVQGDWGDQPDSGVANIAGKQYPHSLGDEVDACYDEKGSVEYNLAKAYRRLSTHAGIGDDAPNDKVVVLIEVLGDNRPLGKFTVPFGKAIPADIDLTDVLRLRLQWQVTETGDKVGCGEATLLLGDPRVEGFPERIPTSGMPTTTTR